MLQVVSPNQMARGAGHMLRWFDKTQAQRVSTGGPVHPCCVHHRRGEAHAVLHKIQFQLQTPAAYIPAHKCD